MITIDGGTGSVIVGEVPLVPPQINEDFQTILGWADDLRRLGVRANADNPDDAARAREFGAQGIGLCRTEHMFFGDERLPVVQEMILAVDEEERRAALDRLLPIQQADFEGIFEAMAGLPVTIRLLDPPLHEFLPSLEEATDERMRARIRALHEANPMLGTRGCRLGPACTRRSTRCRCARSPGRRSPCASGPATRRSSRSCIRSSASREELRRLRELTVARREPRRARARLPRRHDDRAAAGLHPRRRDRRGRRLLLVRHERPHADGARLLARRRRGQVPDALPRGRRARAQPVRGARRGAASAT